MNALDTARAGLTSMTHWYGLPEALFTDRRIQHYPPEYNYQNEYQPFLGGRPALGAGRSAVLRALEPGDGRAARTGLLDPPDLGGLHRNPRPDAPAAERVAFRLYPSEPVGVLRPNAENHASYFFDWTTQVELNWKENYRLWMAFVNEFKNRGGRVAVGSDSGYTFNLYGFGFVQELELMQEAGFHPLEVIKAATLNGAEVLGLDDRLGSVEEEKLADFVVLEENPLQNLKVLYGSGTIRLNHQTGRTERIGSIRYTIKDGIVYDTRKLLSDVRETVRAARAEKGLPPPPMPLFLEDNADHDFPKPGSR